MRRRKQLRRKNEDECDDNNENEDSETYIKCIGTNVYFYSDVSKKTILFLLERMQDAMNNIGTNVPPSERAIYLYIHSDGGEAYAGISAMTHLKTYPCKVVTICDGFLASAATLVFLGGHERRMTKHSHMLIHQLSTSFDGRYAELRDEYKNSTLLMDTMKSIYSTETSIPSEELDECLSNEKIIDAATCIKYNIAHQLI